VRTSGAGLLVCAAMAGCHGEGGWDRLTGSVVDTYVTDHGDVPRPYGPAEVRLSTLCPGPDGWTTVAGTIDEAGAFTIAGVPSHDCYLRMDTLPDGRRWPVFFRAAVPRLELGSVHFGRPDAEAASQPTPLEIDAAPMSPWAANDELELFSLGAGAFGYGLEHLGQAPAVGATSLDAFSVDVAQLARPQLVDGGRGDQLIITHLTRRKAELDPDLARKTSLPYDGIEEVLRPQPPSQHDGESARVTGGFEAVPATSVALDWRMSAFFVQARHVNPQAQAEAHFLSVNADPSGASRTTNDDLPLLIFSGFQADRLTLDFPFTVSMANPFPTGWTPRVSAWSDYSVSWVPNIPADIGTYGPLSELAGQPLDTTITPPRRLTIDGQLVTDPGLHSGPAPTLRWSAPPEGARLYMVTIREQDSSGGWPIAAVFVTDETEVRFPPDLLLPAVPWVAYVTAYDHRSLASPNVLPSRGAYATAVTALLLP
jgi:hypothetical protein